MKVSLLCFCSFAVSLISCTADVEVGKVGWGRDLEKAYADADKSGKPVLVLFQEVPGCAGCKKFGKEVLSHPQVVEAIETEFEPVLVYNNRPGPDAEILKSFREPSWNYQVIRFLDSKGKDIIPRKDKVWTTEAVAGRMIEALRSANRKVPKYLEALAGRHAARNPDEIAFAMFCFWTGERKLGALEGVLSTEAGWIGGREVTHVVYDREVITLEKLVAQAASLDCAHQVYVSNKKDQAVLEKSRLKVGVIDGYRPAKQSDQKKQIYGSRLENLNLSEVQATKINAFARTDHATALQWLSPRQRAKFNKS